MQEMATAASVRSAIEKHLECPICHDRYRQPKVLNCLHSFCEECVMNYHHGIFRGSPKITCPVCRQKSTLPKTGIQGLKTNFHLVGLIEELALQEKVALSEDSKLLCETCKEENKASHHCIDCGKNICSNCRDVHFRFPILFNHTVVTLDEIRQGKVKVIKKPDEYKCHKHKDSVKQFYCKTCDELICHSCTVIEHAKPDHDITESEAAAEDFRETLTGTFAAINKDIKFIEVHLLDTDKAKKSFNENTVKARQEVQERAAEVIAKVKTEEKRILDEITTQEHKQNKQFDEHRKILSDLLQRKKHTLESAKDVTTNASVSNFLSLYPVIKEDIDNLNSHHPPKIPHKLWYLRFVKSQTADDVSFIGKVKQEGDEWELHHEFGKLGSGDGEFKSAGGIAAATPDEIAVADWKNGRVVICNDQGPTSKFLAIGPNDVVAMSNQWVCADPGKVLVYQRDATVAYEFCTVPESEVGKTEVQLVSAAVLKNGNILVGDKKRMMLTEHKPGDGKLIQNMPVKIAPDWLAVMSNGWIVISDWDHGLVGIVDVSDGNPAPVTTIKPTINGQRVKYCNGVMSTNTGIFIAADTGLYTSGHIHQYDCTGHFVCCVVKGLYNPCGITLTADGQELAVADWHSVKIYHKV